MKRAPDGFEDEDDDIGNVEENLGARGRPGLGGNTYHTETAGNKGMAIDQRGTQGKRRSSCKCVCSC